MNRVSVFLGSDTSGTLVALSLIAAAVILHVMGRPAEVFDQAIPIIVALYMGGRAGAGAGAGTVTPSAPKGEGTP